MTNRVRRLILDDDDARHAWCRGLYPNDEVVSVYRFSDCIAQLAVVGREPGFPPFDVLHLDHDLADRVEHVHRATGKLPDTKAVATVETACDGRDVVDWLIRHPARCPRMVRIHSWAMQAEDMERALLAAGICAVRRKQAPV